MCGVFNTEKERKKEKEDITTGPVNPQVNPQVLNCYFNLIFIHSDWVKVCLSNTSVHICSVTIQLERGEGGTSSNNICEWKTLQDQNKQYPAKKKKKTVQKTFSITIYKYSSVVCIVRHENNVLIW